MTTPAPYVFPTDTNGRAGAVVPFMENSQFAVPMLDLIGNHRVLQPGNLAASATYTGPTRDRMSGGVYEARVRFFVDTNAASATAGLVVEESHDGTTFVVIGTGTTVAANTLADTGWRTLSRRYWRLRYVNSTTAQTRFDVTELRDTLIDDVVASGTVSINAGAQVREFAPQFTDSTTALAAAATFTGTARDLGATNVSAAYVRARAFSDVAGTLVVEQSRDNTTFRSPTEHSFSVAAGAVIQVEVPVVARYVRLRYVNGATAQTAFELLSHLGTA